MKKYIYRTLFAAFASILTSNSNAECINSILDYDNNVSIFIGKIESQHVTVFSYDTESIHDFKVIVNKNVITTDKRYDYYNKLFDMCVKIYK